MSSSRHDVHSDAGRGRLDEPALKKYVAINDGVRRQEFPMFTMAEVTISILLTISDHQRPPEPRRPSDRRGRQEKVRGS